MKGIPFSLVYVCQLTFAAAIVAQTTEKYDDDLDVIGFFGDMRPQYYGMVTAVEHALKGTAAVHIRATTEYRPLGGEAYEVSEECVLLWTRSDQPVPFAPGIRLEFSADDDGRVTAARYVAALPYYRKNADGLIEVLLHVSVGTGKERVWVPTLPDRINLMPGVDVGWSRQHGLVMSIFEADGGDEEEESLRTRDKGLPVANVPGERIQIGRDGWKKTPDLDHEKSKGVVPPKQYIGAAG
jgi:hypothetical protein